MTAPSNLIVIGGGEHARVVMDAVRTRPDLFCLLGYTDVRAIEETSDRVGTTWLGADATALASYPDALFVLGLGGIHAAKLRERLARVYEGRNWATVVHLNAFVSPSIKLGVGVTVLAGACINTGATVGDHVVINTGAIVEHDVSLGAMTQVAPRAVIGGGARVGRTSYIGMGAIVRDHVSIGDDAVVAMGAVVIRNVPSGETVLGIPAHPVGSSSGSRSR